MKLITLLITIGISTVTIAQTNVAGKKSCNCGFSTINQLGVMEGGSSSAFHLQTINGFRYRTWYAGIGVGLDYYVVRGIPVFLDIRKTLFNKVNSPFVYADGGIHFGWGRDNDGHIGYNDREFNNGPYVDAGLGYRIGLGKTTALLLSAGYSYKYVKETVSYYTACTWGGCQEFNESYKQYLNRISIKAGIQF